MFKSLKEYIFRQFREWYENRISLPFGIRQFQANVAFIQVTNEEFLMLNPPSNYCGDIYLTVEGARPTLTYPVWLPGMEYPKDPKNLPVVNMIIENDSKFQIKGETDWEPITLMDPRIAPLKDLFLGFAFYPSLRKEMKQKKAQ